MPFPKTSELQMNKFIKGWVFTLLFLAGFTVFGQDDGKWKLKKNKNGIEIFTTQSDTSAFMAFKARMTIQGSVGAFVAVLQDLDHMPDWGYNIEYARLLEKSGDTLVIYYSEASVPFPFANRDGIYLNRFIWNNQSRQLKVDIELLHNYLEVKEKLVRVKGNGEWLVKVLGDDSLEMIFRMQVDPGGEIPAWLVNMFIDETPYETMVNIREMMKKPEYRQRKYDFIN
jgi:hypothetical protein